MGAHFWHTYRDVFGDCVIVGDKRWAGSHGVSADFLARENSCVFWIDISEVKVTFRFLH